MGRKRREPANGTAVAEPNGTMPDDKPEAGNRPCQSYSVAAGNQVWIEASVWPRQITIDEKEVTVYSATVRKTYRKEDKTYGHTGFFKGSELPLVAFVLKQAEEYILAQRLKADPPF